MLYRIIHVVLFPVTLIDCYLPLTTLFKVVSIDLYHDSSLKRSGIARVNEGSHSFTCHPHVYPQVE